MAALTGNSIDSSYQGLIKTTDNGAITATAKAVTDGLGNATNITISNTSTNFVSGTVDFTGSTVQGLPGGSAGLENGTGTDSLQSAASLTTNPANASGNYSIALGEGASATRQESVAIGQNAAANGTGSDGSIAIGNGAVASSNRSVVIGVNNSSSSSEGIAIGDDVDIANSDRSIGIGGAINISGGNDKVGIGTSATVGGTRAIAIGQNATADGANSVVMGYNASDNGAQDVVIIGNGANTANNGDDYSVVIGKDAQSTVGNGIAIGQDAQSDGINTIMIGRGSAGTFNTIGLGITTTVNANEAIAIGYQADVQAGSNNGISIGVYSEVQGNNRDAIAIGQSTSARAEGAVALGDAVIAAKSQTVSVKALETQTNSTPTAGGIIMADAGGTERRLNITATGGLQIDSTAVGGGGAPSHPARFAGTGETASTFEGPYTFFTNQTYFFAIHLNYGEEVAELSHEIGTAFTSTTLVGMALYDSQLRSNGEYGPRNLLADWGTASATTAGVKTFSGQTYTATYTGMHFIALSTNGQWDGTFRQTESGVRSYTSNNYFTNGTTLGIASTAFTTEPLRITNTGSMVSQYADTAAFSNTSARLALHAKTAQNI